MKEEVLGVVSEIDVCLQKHGKSPNLLLVAPVSLLPVMVMERARQLACGGVLQRESEAREDGPDPELHTSKMDGRETSLIYKTILRTVG